MAKTHRYEWEDALIDAQVAGHISNGALLLALKLSRAIHWAPKGGKPAGLYWKNDDALKSVGAGRTTYFRHKGELFSHGFLTQEKGNLIPCMPESLGGTPESTKVVLEKSLGGTSGNDTESQVETDNESESTKVVLPESLGGTEKSLGGTPLSVDTLSVDVVSEEKQADATAPAEDSSPHLEDMGSSSTTLSSQSERSDGSSDEEFRKSLGGTPQEIAHQKALALQAKKAQLPPVPKKQVIIKDKETLLSW